MTNSNKPPLGQLLAGIVLLVLGGIAFFKAHGAGLQRVVIPFKSGSQSPTHAYIVAALCLLVGLYLVGVWLWKTGTK
jgi:hypothetical protein